MTETNDFDADIDKMTRIAQVIKEFDSPDVQALAYATLAARAFGTPLPSRDPVTQGVDPAGLGDVVDLDADSDSAGLKPAKKSAAKKAGGRRGGKKVTYDVPKDIDFAPAGKQSLADFAAEKAPQTNPEKALVAVYYLTKVLGRKVTTGEVIAVFRSLGWSDPSNPDNNLQQAGIKHWLDTASMSDIKLVWGGESYVESKLPKAVKKK